MVRYNNAIMAVAPQWIETTLEEASARPLSEIDILLGQLLHLRAKRVELSLTPQETNLLLKIETIVPQELLAKRRKLSRKNNLSPTEKEEFLSITTQIEEKEVLRLQYIAELAKLREISVNEALIQFELRPRDRRNRVLNG
jgi:hypothetical protein